MTYSVYDFSESLNQAKGFSQPDIAECVASWGETGDDNEWSGGFLLKLKDGRFAYLTGWCDYTGWGCQDGAETTFFDKEPDRTSLESGKSWDEKPNDIARFLAGEIKAWD